MIDGTRIAEFSGDRDQLEQQLAAESHELIRTAFGSVKSAPVRHRYGRSCKTIRLAGRIVHIDHHGTHPGHVGSNEFCVDYRIELP